MAQAILFQTGAYLASKTSNEGEHSSLCSYLLDWLLPVVWVLDLQSLYSLFIGYFASDSDLVAID